MSWTTISGLLRTGSPSNISRFVIAFIVRKAIHGMFQGRARSHISEKCFKVHVPFWADFNASAPIVFVASVFWIIATSTHVYPNPELIGAGLSVFLIGVRYSFSSPASTRNGFLIEKTLDPNNRFVSTIASAQNAFVSILGWSCVGQHRQAIESQTDYVSGRFGHSREFYAGPIIW